ncbi:MAG: pantothenate kinase [Bacteroidetes bacterium]|nr:MAG: pantothenate kinase [Bacteroidota bacterium]
MNLILDLGNTRCKIAVVEGKTILESGNYARLSPKEIARFHERHPGIEGVIVSSVVNYSRELIDYLATLFPTCIELNASTPIPLTNLYATPETLGYDRIAAVVGAHSLYPGMNALVIDAGTAITYDLITASGTYPGGNISPGLDTRFRALHKFTNRLPLLERPASGPVLVGSKTQEAIQAGVVHGIVFEMDGFIRSIGLEYPDLQVVLTGGDAKFFAGKLKSSIFVDPVLNLIGLNSILVHNAK